MPLPSAGTSPHYLVKAVFSRDGRRAAVLDDEANLRVYDVSTGRQLWWTPRPSHAMATFPHNDPLAFSPNGQLVAAGFGNASEVHVFSTRDGSRRAVYPHTPGGTVRVTPWGDTIQYWADFPIGSVVFSPDGRTVGAVAAGALIRWDLARGVPFDTAWTASVQPQGSSRNTIVHDAAFHPRGGYFATAALDGVVRFYLARTGAQVSWLPPLNGTAYRVAFSPDGRRILTTVGDGPISVWSARTGKLLTSIPMSRVVAVLAVSPDGRLLAAGNYWGGVRLWSLETGEELQELLPRGIRPTPIALAFTPDGRRLLGVTMGKDRVFLSWEVRRR